MAEQDYDLFLTGADPFGGDLDDPPDWDGYDEQEADADRWRDE
jgi:hypothetical protein